MNKQFVFLLFSAVLFFCSVSAQTQAENIAKAQLLFNNKEYKQERKFLNTCLKKDKYFSEYYFLRAECNYADGKINDAFEDIDRAINLGYDSLKYRITKADYHESVLQAELFHKDVFVIEFDKAIEVLKAAYPIAKNAKDSSDIMAYIGTLKEEMGDTSGAITELKNAIRIDSTNVDAMLDLAGIYNDIDSTDLCLHYAEKILVKDSANVRALNCMGLVYMDLEKYADALVFFNKSLAIDSLDPTDFENRSRTKLKLGDTKGAMQDIRKAIALDDKDPYAYYILARVYEKMSEPAKACKALDDALTWGFTEYHGQAALNMKVRLCGQ